jgi:hypothetical protein
MKNKLMEWLKWWSACPASLRPRVQIPVPQKKKKSMKNKIWSLALEQFR